MNISLQRVLSVVIGCLCVGAGVMAKDAVVGHPAFIALDTNTFAVCQCFLAHRLIQRWNGVVVSRENVLVPNCDSFGILSELGPKPADGGDPYRYYGTVPYPVVEVDPPFAWSLSRKGRLRIGFCTSWAFYVVKEIEKAVLKSGVPEKCGVQRGTVRSIPIALPAHSVGEFRKLLAKLVEGEQGVLKQLNDSELLKQLDSESVRNGKQAPRYDSPFPRVTVVVNRPPQPAFIGIDDDTFAVCMFLRDREVIQKWKGVALARENIFESGSYREILICEFKPRPADGGNRYHHYGPVPYPVEDVDPPLVCRVDHKGTLKIGFASPWAFYVVKEIKKPALKQPVVKMLGGPTIPVSLPPHRAAELRKLLTELIEGDQPSLQSSKVRELEGRI